jgi:hypothetical protein
MRTTAIFTFVNRHNFFLDKWLEWHTKFFAPEDIYIVFEKNDYFKFDLQSYLISNGLHKVKVISVDYFNYDNNINDRINNIALFLSKTQSELLKKYNVVCCTDIDEFLFHPDLKNILQTFDEDYLTPHGVEIVQNLDFEKDLDLSKIIMSQRSYCANLENHFARGNYSKPIIIKKELVWGAGKHHKNLEDAIMKENLYLIHINKIDFNQLIKMNNENVKSGGHSEHDNMGSMETLMKRLNQYSYYINYTPHLVKIPEVIKENFTI